MKLVEVKKWMDAVSQMVLKSPLTQTLSLEGKGKGEGISLMFKVTFRCIYLEHLQEKLFNL